MLNFEFTDGTSKVEAIEVKTLTCFKDDVVPGIKVLAWFKPSKTIMSESTFMVKTKQNKNF